MKPCETVVLNAALANLDRLATSDPDPLLLSSLKDILRILLRDWDDLAAARVQEIESLGDLLRRAAQFAPEDRAAGWRDAAEESKNARTELRLPSLDAALSRVQKALIDLQAWLETTATPQAEALLADTWSAIAPGVIRRASSNYSWF
jgi:hypothetical protein